MDYMQQDQWKYKYKYSFLRDPVPGENFMDYSKFIGCVYEEGVYEEADRGRILVLDNCSVVGCIGSSLFMKVK